MELYITCKIMGTGNLCRNIKDIHTIFKSLDLHSEDGWEYQKRQGEKVTCQPWDDNLELVVQNESVELMVYYII